MKLEKLSCKSCTLKKCFIKSNCSPKWIEEIDKEKVNIQFKKDQTIIYGGQPVQGLYFIYSGKVKVVLVGYKGTEQIVRLTKPAHVLGHRGEGNEVHLISAIAIDHTLVCFIENSTIHNAFLENAKLSLGLMMYYSQELRKIETRVKYIAQMTVRERVAEGLLFIGEVFGEHKGLRISFDVLLKRKELAAIAGTNVEQVSRMLTELRNDGLIEVVNNKISIINKHKFIQEINLGNYNPLLFS